MSLNSHGITLKQLKNNPIIESLRPYLGLIYPLFIMCLYSLVLNSNRTALFYLTFLALQSNVLLVAFAALCS